MNIMHNTRFATQNKLEQTEFVKQFCPGLMNEKLSKIPLVDNDAKNSGTAFLSLTNVKWSPVPFHINSSW